MKRIAKQITFNRIPKMFPIVESEDILEVNIYYCLDTLNKMLSNELNENFVLEDNKKNGTLNDKFLDFAHGVLNENHIGILIYYHTEQKRFIELKETFNATKHIPLGCFFDSVKCNAFIKKQNLSDKYFDIIDEIHHHLSDYIIQFIILKA